MENGRLIVKSVATFNLIRTWFDYDIKIISVTLMIQPDIRTQFVRFEPLRGVAEDCRHPEYEAVQFRRHVSLIWGHHQVYMIR
jgi:hypothetical protein